MREIGEWRHQQQRRTIWRQPRQPSGSPSADPAERSLCLMRSGMPGLEPVDLRGTDSELLSPRPTGIPWADLDSLAGDRADIEGALDDVDAGW